MLISYLEVQLRDSWCGRHPMAYLWVNDSIGMEYLLMVPDSLPYKHTQIKFILVTRSHNVLIITCIYNINTNLSYKYQFIGILAWNFFPILTTIKTLSEAQMAHTGSSVPYKKVKWIWKFHTIGNSVLNWWLYGYFSQSMQVYKYSWL